MFRTKTIIVATRHAFFQQPSRHAARQLTRRKWQSGGVLLAMLLFAGVLSTIAALADGATTILVSVNSAGTFSSSGSFDPSISANNGRYVAFSSEANNLTANDTNAIKDVFVRDLQTGTTTLVSVNITGTGGGNHVSLDPSINANGRFVAFSSLASDLVANDTNGTIDVFVRDLWKNTTRLVSYVNSAGTAGGNSSYSPSISADGRYVAFSSGANNLIVNDTNLTTDVFVRDLEFGITLLVSRKFLGTESGNGPSLDPSISFYGGHVAFHSAASDLTANDTNGTYDVFVYDLKDGATELASVSSAATSGSGNSGSFSPSISAHGRYVAFNSGASDLTLNDTNNNLDVFMRDVQSETTTMVSVNRAGTNGGNHYSYESSISSDGRYVAFRSDAGDLTAINTFRTSSIFVRDLQTSTTSLVSVNNNGAIANNVSFNPSIDSDGRIVAFRTKANNLDTRDSGNGDDIYVRELSPAPAPAQIQFDSATYSVTENGTGATITVTRSGNLSAPVTVNYATSDDTALAGSDYDSTANTLVFAANETTQTFTVPITNNSTTESSETLNLTLSSPSSDATLGTQSTAVLTITDDDTDADGDGIPDASDNCPNVSNADQANTDGDSEGDACDADDDNDTVLDASDNCPLVSNSDQLDSDGDTIGNVCDADDDNDGINDASDNCPLIANSTQADTDADGLGDACDAYNEPPANIPVSTLTLTPTSVNGGVPSTGKVTLSRVAPAGGASVVLSSNNAAAASVPQSVIVPGGGRIATFPVTTYPVAANTAVRVSAIGGGTTKIATLTIKAPVLTKLILSPTSVTGGIPSTGTVTLSGAAPAGGTLATLFSNNTAAATVPASITVDAGATTATFVIATSPVAANKSVTIASRVGTVSKTAQLIVKTPVVSLVTLDPTSVVGGATSLGTVTLTGVAPTGGAVVTLRSSRTTAATVPASVTVAGGASTATFIVTTRTVTASTTATISATRSVTKTAILSVTPSQQN
ncbi:MAG: thrombospondin type 3 repeat-containing protein [Pyrinomonadaceae bacterium MAG19_C2-C3]|nr:thrombospondin type 3 repeat-containing protein [Pyrinomonadaceae bacterium MAG19_C2-C3]